jgi:hypothetical protein
MGCSPPPAQILNRRRATLLARFRPFGPLLLIWFAAGCFEYSNRPRDHLALGREIRITLTPDGRTGLASKVGTQVRSVEGQLRSADTSGVTIAMSRTTLLDGTEAPWSGEIVLVPSSDIAVAEQRAPAAGKTVALVAIITGLTAAVALSVGLSSASGSGGVAGSTAK